MDDKNDGPHLYGTPDPNNPEPVSKGGMKGERSGDQEADAPTMSRKLEVEGRDVTIEQTSGSVYAEETGKAGKGNHDEEDR